LRKGKKKRASRRNIPRKKKGGSDTFFRGKKKKKGPSIAHRSKRRKRGGDRPSPTSNKGRTGLVRQQRKKKKKNKNKVGLPQDWGEEKVGVGKSKWLQRTRKGTRAMEKKEEKKKKILHSIYRGRGPSQGNKGRVLYSPL